MEERLQPQEDPVQKLLHQALLHLQQHNNLRQALQQLQRQTEADLERLWQNVLELVEALLSLTPGKKTILSCVFVLIFVALGDILFVIFHATDAVPSEDEVDLDPHQIHLTTKVRKDLAMLLHFPHIVCPVTLLRKRISAASVRSWLPIFRCHEVVMV